MREAHDPAESKDPYTAGAPTAAARQELSAFRNHSHSRAFFLSSIITFRRARLMRVW